MRSIVVRGRARKGRLNQDDALRSLFCGLFLSADWSRGGVSAWRVGIAGLLHQGANHYCKKEIFFHLVSAFGVGPFSRPRNTVFSVGTTSVFPYIAGPVEVARRSGWATVEINPAATRVSRLVDVKLSLRAAEAMDAIWTRYRARGVESDSNA